MPSTSKKQANFMAAVAHNPEFAKKAGVPQEVGEEFNKADKGKKIGSRPDLQGINKPKTDHGSMNLYKKGGIMKGKNLFKGKETYSEELKEAKAIKSGKITPQQYAAGEEGEKKMKKMADGGMTDPRAKMMMAKLGADRAGRAMPAPTADMRGRAMPKRPMAAEAAAPMMKKGGMTKMAKGGGIESKGKTKGKMIVMKRGGKTC